MALTDILAGKKKAYAELARLINSTKDELDKSLTRLNRLKELRECEGKLFIHGGVVVVVVVVAVITVVVVVVWW